MFWTRGAAFVSVSVLVSARVVRLCFNCLCLVLFMCCFLGVSVLVGCV